jgi:hypothetical protein
MFILVSLQRLQVVRSNGKFPQHLSIISKQNDTEIYLLKVANIENKIVSIATAYQIS